MTDFIETIENNPKTQKDIELTVDKNSSDSYRTQSRIDKTALILRSIFEEAIVFWEKHLRKWTTKLVLKMTQLHL